MSIKIQFDPRRAAAVLIGIVLVLGIGFYVLERGPQVEERHPDDDYVVYTDDTVQVNSTSALNDSGYVEDTTSFQIMYGQYATDFDVYGFYQGNVFYYGRYPEEGDVIMEIGPDLDPNDEVIEGFMVGRLVGAKESPDINVTAYVDQQFMDAVDTTNIVIWNQYRGTMDERDAEFTEVSPGIYRLVIEDKYTARFLPQERYSSANIFLGEVMVEDGDIVHGDMFMGLE